MIPFKDISWVKESDERVCLVIGDFSVRCTVPGVAPFRLGFQRNSFYRVVFPLKQAG